MPMLEMNLFRTPTVGNLVQHDFNNFSVRIVNPGDAVIVQMDMGGGRWGHGMSTPYVYIAAIIPQLNKAGGGSLLDARDDAGYNAGRPEGAISFGDAGGGIGCGGIDPHGR